MDVAEQPTEPRQPPATVHDRPRLGWAGKFRVAARGVLWAMRTQVNFKVHLLFVAVVVATASMLGATLVEWCLLALCIAIVLSAETFNTALEHLARAVTREQNEEVRHALDVAAGAVLIVVVGAVVVGLIILANQLMRWLGS